MEDVERDTMRIVRRRVFYCLFVMFLLNQIDRTNVGFAALQLNVQLGFNAEVYGFGTGLFFFSYLLAEMPSNLMLERFGPRMCRYGIGRVVAGSVQAWRRRQTQSLYCSRRMRSTP
jgi:sugar phosphate permease